VIQIVVLYIRSGWTLRQRIAIAASVLSISVNVLTRVLTYLLSLCDDDDAIHAARQQQQQQQQPRKRNLTTERTTQQEDPCTGDVELASPTRSSVRSPTVVPSTGSLAVDHIVVQLP
jgi:hypothetical protein